MSSQEPPRNEKDEMSAVFLPRVKTTKKVTGSRDQPPRGLQGTLCKRRRNQPYTPDWGAGEGGGRGTAGGGAGALERKEGLRCGSSCGKSSSDEDLGSEWGPTAVSKVSGTGAVSSSLPTPRASFEALSRHLPTDEPA